MKVVHWWVLREEVKPSFIQSVTVFTVKSIGVPLLF
jgi:hypothetical protein